VSARQIKAVMFDLDGTLLDTAPEFVTCVNRLLVEENREPISAELLRNQVSNGSVAMIAYAFGIDATHPEFEPLRQRLLDYYIEQIGSDTQFFSGIAELLQQLDARGLSWGIATNKPSLYTHALLKVLDIKPAPRSVICPDDVQHRKPHPESLFLAGQHLDCLPHNIVYIGDHKRDIDCGKDAGAITIAAAFGYIEDDDNVDSWGADYKVERGEDIWPVIQSLLD